ncbi:Signal peptidase complex catalytic subunit SEC11A [Merluccius polli]|uniref:Signal peptidase complex catalytic subunit SEC11 n=1 Tax=Merluccius polli TaxID=89951 RepID=A0AA47NCS7_MERPO|nr:Signal peptidase complex catalytic subunit SEC11A [Merluccius polli]
MFHLGMIEGSLLRKLLLLQQCPPGSSGSRFLAYLSTGGRRTGREALGSVSLWSEGCTAQDPIYSYSCGPVVNDEERRGGEKVAWLHLGSVLEGFRLQQADPLTHGRILLKIRWRTTPQCSVAVLTETVWQQEACCVLLPGPAAPLKLVKYPAYALATLQPFTARLGMLLFGRGSRGRMLSGVQVSSEQVVLSLMRKQVVSDSAVLTSAGRSVRHSGAKTEKSCDLAVRRLLALRDGGTGRPAELYYQLLNFGMIVSSALMIWKGLMVVTGSESPIVVVLSGSMEPAFHRGDLLFLTNRVEDPIRVGEIVVFRIEGREIPIVHRVLKIHEKENGDIKFLTKGDNNAVDDRGLYKQGQHWLEKKDVVGRARGFVPYIGIVTILMNDYPKFKVGYY